MRLLKGLSILAFAVMLPALLQAQCAVTISQGDTIHANCGDDVILSSPNGSGNVYWDDFNSGVADTVNLWNFTSNPEFTNPCGPNPLSNSTYLWMGASSTNPRAMETQGLDLSCGGTICFDLKMAAQGGVSPCEGPDMVNEGVRLQYSINLGATWIEIYLFNPDTNCCGCTSGCVSDPNNPFIVWANYCFTIPPTAQTSQTKIRWIQNANSSSAFDNWGIDEVSINSSCMGYSFAWSTSQTTDTIQLNGLLSDTLVWIEKTNGIDTCSDSIFVIVDALGITANSSLNSACLGAQLTLNIDPNTIVGYNPNGNYNINWAPTSGLSTPTQPSTGATLLASTDYTVTVSRVNFPSCTAIDTVSVAVFNPLVIDSVIVTAEHCGTALGGIADGSIEIFGSGGSGAYQYNFGSGFGINAMATGLTTQLYPVTFFDSISNCSVDTMILIPLDSGLVLNSLSGVDVSCYGVCDASAAAQVSNGTGNVNFTWVGTGQSGVGLSQVSGLCPQTLVLQVQDNFCTLQDSVVLAQPDSSLLLVQTLVENAICSNEPYGGAIVLATGGTAPYSYNWPALNLQATTAINILPGNYQVIATDQNGCSTQVTAIVGYDFLAPTLNLGADTTICEGEVLSLSATANMSSYNWSNGDTVASQQFSTAGIPWVEITDSNGCSNSDTLELNYFLGFPPPMLGPDTTLTMADSFLLDAGSGYASYLWTAPDSLTTQTNWATTTGTYIVIVSDGNGCTISDTIQLTFYPTGMEEANLFSEAGIFPNPSKGHFQISLPQLGGQLVQVSINNNLGQTVVERATVLDQQGQMIFDLEAFDAGIYLVGIRYGDYETTLRLILE